MFPSSPTARRAGGVPQVARVVPGHRRPGTVPTREELPQRDSCRVLPPPGWTHRVGGRSST